MAPREEWSIREELIRQGGRLDNLDQRMSALVDTANHRMSAADDRMDEAEEKWQARFDRLTGWFILLLLAIIGSTGALIVAVLKVGG